MCKFLDLFSLFTFYRAHNPLITLQFALMGLFCFNLLRDGGARAGGNFKKNRMGYEVPKTRFVG